MSVEHFTEWFLSSMPPIWAIPHGESVWKIEDVTSVLLYRKAPFQVQMFIVPPKYTIPEHTHPNVDSIEVYLGGEIRFSHGGKYVLTEEQASGHWPDGTALKRGVRIRVRPYDLHGGTFGEHGGVFLSAQEWLNGVAPHCVAADYTGTVMGPDHFSKVLCGAPVLSENKCAASQEVA